MTPEESVDTHSRKSKKRKGNGPCQAAKKLKIDTIPFDQVDSLSSPLRPSYVREAGLQKVKPYFFVFSAYAKRRWLSRKLLEVMNAELQPRLPLDFELSVKLGRLLVNGNPISDTSYVLKDNDLIEHVIHRHEAAVLEQPIEIIHDDENVVVINKPCSLPVHPCGRYRHNTVMYILKWEYGYIDLKCLYRLDRLTSGLLIFPKNLATSQKMEQHLRESQVSKEYVCLVDGVFPSEPVECDQPLACLSPKMGLYHVSKDGKPSLTKFERLGTNGKQSVVKCYPKTGRTHQIRIHLQYLGYPIVNDYLYNSDVFGPNKGKNAEYGKSLEKLMKDVWDAHDAKIYLMDDTVSCEPGENNDVLLIPSNENGMSSTMPLAEEPISGEVAFDKALISEITADYDPYCPDCCMTAKKFRDPLIEELTMFLHCLHYKGPDWEWETPLPAWATAILEANNSKS